MARGWESKSVEAQIDMAETLHYSADPVKPVNPRQLELVRKRETLQDLIKGETIPEGLKKVGRKG